MRTWRTEDSKHEVCSVNGEVVGGLWLLEGNWLWSVDGLQLLRLLLLLADFLPDVMSPS